MSLNNNKIIPSDLLPTCRPALKGGKIKYIKNINKLQIRSKLACCHKQSVPDIHLINSRNKSIPNTGRQTVEYPHFKNNQLGFSRVVYVFMWLQHLVRYVLMWLQHLVIGMCSKT